MSWRRLESAAVDPDLVEGLEARLADPLWLLARQWQAGEFKGDDAANPLLVRVEARSVPVERLVLPGGREVDLDDADTPLEPLVEREEVRRGPAAARVAADLGRLLVRALRRAGGTAAEPLVTALRERFGLSLPADDLDPAGRRRLALQAREGLDGTALEAALARDPALLDGLLADAGIPPADRPAVTRVVDDWRHAGAEIFSEPVTPSAWDPQRMEYRFALEGTAPDGTPLRLTAADGYRGGHLDWYAFDRAAVPEPPTPPGPLVAIVPPPPPPPPGTVVRRAEVLPAPLRFRGMPAARFWEFEEGDVDFGGIEAGPEDLARVAVAGYALVHGGDWFLVPLRLPVGTLTEITRVEVLDDFGRTTTVPAAAVVDGGGPARAFKFFELTGDPNPSQGRAPLLFLPPSVATAEAARPLEDVRFLRDEVANLAWAVEDRVESPAGRPVDLAARGGPPPARGPAEPGWRLTLATPFPAHWVPLVPVRLTEDEAGAVDGTIMLQRGRVPAADGTTRGARGEILLPGRRLLLHEEELPREGLRVVRRFQSARDPAGRLHTWTGRRKGPGNPPAHSTLSFDTIERG